MAKVRILSASDIEKLFTLDMAVKAVENAYRQKSTGEGSVWPMVFHEFVHGEADLDIKSGDLKCENIFGLKVVSWYGSNEKHGLPDLFGTSLLFDRETGEPKALLNAGPVTGLRTGAAGAIGARVFARQNSEKLLMVGCGAQSPYLIAATLFAMPSIRQVMLCNPRNPAKAEEKLACLSAKVESLLHGCGAERTYTTEAATDLEAAVKNSDIILTATPSYEPMIRTEWVQPGTHFSCIGSDMTGKQEIDSDILGRALVFGDDEKQCLSVGECEKPYQQGVIAGLKAEIGDVITGKAEGRQKETDITVFDSTGIALQDLSSAAVILAEAEKKNIGTIAEL